MRRFKIGGVEAEVSQGSTVLKVRGLALFATAATAFGLLAAAQRTEARTQEMQVDRAARASTRNLSEADRAREIMNAFGVCVVRTRLAAVRKALQTPEVGPDEAALARLATSDCLSNGELRMSQQLMRGAVYRALYLREFGRVAEGASPASGEPDETVAPLRRFAFCVVERDPANTRALVLANVATDAEKQAFAAIMPALSDCIAPGDKIKFSRTVLQGVLAEAAYQRATKSTVVNR